ncbi:hypothetical protein ACWGPO_22955 [Achromobacter animicus]
MNQNNAAHIAALEDLRLGVELDRHHLDDGDAKLAALDAALALLSKLRAPVADERAAFEASEREINSRVDLSYEWRTEEYKTSWIMERWLTWRRAWQARDALASAPVAGEAQPVAWRYHVEGDPVKWYFSDTASLLGLYQPLYAAPQASPDTSEADASPIVPGGPYSDPEDLIAALDAAPQASEAVRSERDATGRTPTDYALEFAEYLARNVEYAMACLNSSQRANEALLDLTEEVATADAYQAAEDAAAQADEAFTEAITALQSAVFEFRKRRDRAALSAQPGAQRTGGSDA